MQSDLINCKSGAISQGSKEAAEKKMWSEVIEIGICFNFSSKYFKI